MSDNIKVIAILGPTSSGKSDLAIQLARKFNGEIVSADSRQVYKGLDLGTGKVTKSEQSMARHHCLDIVDPPKRWKSGVQPFTMQQYRRCADRAIQDIWSRGRVPFLVGGSQLYVRGVLYDYDVPPVPPDLEYRIKLEKKSLKALQKQLYHVDSIMSTWNDRNNKRRVIRALEIYYHSKQKPSKWYHVIPNTQAKPPRRRGDPEDTKVAVSLAEFNPAEAGARDDRNLHGMTLRYNTLQLCIDVPREKLYARIDQRVDMRVRKGMIGEVRRLREQGVSKKWLRSLGLEYRFISDYLDSLSSRPRIAVRGKLRPGSREEMLERLKYATHNFARRQLMWYRKENDITYVTSYTQADRVIKKFLRLDSRLRGNDKHRC